MKAAFEEHLSVGFLRYSVLCLRFASMDSHCCCLSLLSYFGSKKRVFAEFQRFVINLQAFGQEKNYCSLLTGCFSVFRLQVH